VEKIGKNVNDVTIKNIDIDRKIVYFTDGTKISYPEFIEYTRHFFQNFIAGETLMPWAIEHFMRRTSSKNLSQLMEGKKMEGYLEGTMDRLLTRGQKIAIGTVIALVFVGLIVFVVLKNQGMIPV